MSLRHRPNDARCQVLFVSSQWQLSFWDLLQPPIVVLNVTVIEAAGLEAKDADGR